MGPSTHNGIDRHKFEKEQRKTLEKKEVLLDYFYDKYKDNPSSKNWESLTRAMFDYQQVKEATSMGELDQDKIDQDYLAMERL